MKKKKQTPWKVIIAIILGMIVGSATQQGSTLFGIDLFDLAYPIYGICGKVFINALTLVVVPLVSSSIITGIARIGNETAFKRLGLKTFGFYFCTSVIAILIGLFFVNLLNPGSAINPETLATYSNIPDIQKHLQTQEGIQFSDVLLKIVPSNIIETFSRGEMLGLIFFSLIFGYCLSKIESRNSATLISFWQGIFQAMIEFTHIILKFLPIGVFFLVAKVFCESGLSSLHSLGTLHFSCDFGSDDIHTDRPPPLAQICGESQSHPPFSGDGSGDHHGFFYEFFLGNFASDY